MLWRNRLSLKALPLLSLSFAILVLVVGYALAGSVNRPKWFALGILLYATPLLLQFTPSRLVRVYGLWFGGFLLLQSAVTPLVMGYKRDLITLPPNLDKRVVSPVPGIEGVQRVTTDEKGFRVIPPVDYAAKRGLRVFAIGGSTTEEIGLDDRATWTHLLQENLEERLGRDVEVINTGVAGIRARHHLATLREVLRYRPDLIILLVGVNDWNKDIRDHFGSSDDRGSEDLNSSLTFRNTLLGSAVGKIWLSLNPGAEWTRSGRTASDGVFILDYMLKQANSLARDIKISFFPEDVSSEYRNTIERISVVCKENEVQCLFATQPNAYSFAAPEELIRRFWMTPPSEKYTLTLESLVHVSRIYNQFLVSFGKEKHHQVCDIAAKIPLDVFFDDVHFNAAGARRVADELTPCALRALRSDLRLAGHGAR